MEIGAEGFELAKIADGMGSEAGFPESVRRVEAFGESVLEKSDGLVERMLRSEKEVDTVGHDEEGVEFVVAAGAVVEEGFDEEFCEARDVEDRALVMR
jgi:hypothetical protein